MELRSATHNQTMRKSLHGALAGLLKDSEKMLKKSDEDKDIVEIEAIKDQIEYNFEQLKVIDTAVLNGTEDEKDLARLMNESVTNSSKVVEVLSKLRGAANKLYKQDEGTQERNSIASQGKAHAKLPKLSVPSFRGEYMEWQAFWDAYQSAVGQNTELNNIQKLQYLLSYLEGEAKRVVEGYRLTEANYEQVVAVLKERYGDDKIAICMHFEKLFAMPSGDQTKAKLSDIYYECEQHIRSLIALGLEEETFGLVFVPLILSKIPKGIRLQLHRNNQGKPWELKELRARLKDEIKFREMSETYVSDSVVREKVQKVEGQDNPTRSKPVYNNYSNNKGRFSGSNQRPWDQTRSTLVASGKGQAEPGYCFFCVEQGHLSSNCRRYDSREDRLNRLAELRACYRCLKTGHNRNNCQMVMRPCGICRDMHHTALCGERQVDNEQFWSKEGGNREKEFTRTGGNQFRAQEGESSGFSTGVTHGQTLAADIQGQAGGENLVKVQMELAQVRFQNGKQAYIYLDKGSTVSYMTKRLVQKLGLKIDGTHTLSIGSFSSGKRKTAEYPTTTVYLPTKNDGRIPLQVYVLDTITAPVQQHGFNLEKVPELNWLQMSVPIQQNSQQREIDILIGLDQYRKFVTGESKMLSNGLEVIGSKFGYIMSGPFESDEETEYSTSMVTTLLRSSVHVENSDMDMEQFWNLESIGIKDNPYLDDDETAIQHFNSTVIKRGGRYEVKWPYKEKEPDLPTNFGLAFGRLKSLFQRFEGQPEIFEEYKQILEEQLEKGMVEEVKVMDSPHRIHYVPHHFVLDRTRETTKMRMVFDASAKMAKDKLSLNECLLRGPVILEDLCGMLIRFRMGKVALSSDIEKAFLQVGLQESEKDVTRFLWLKDISKPVTKENLKVLRFRRVPFGYISSPFLLSATVKHHLEQEGSEVALDMMRNVYVDNVLGVRDSTESGLAYYHKAKELFAEIKMNIRQWCTNDEVLWEQIPENDRARNKRSKVLGMTWDTTTDEICVRPPKRFFAEIDSKITKRQVVSIVASAFDPCGILSPVVIKAKMLVQQLWEEKIKWDEPIPNNYLEEVKVVVEERLKMEDLKVPRWIRVQGSTQLHTFSDASAKAYGAVSYLRTESSDGISVNLVYAKARLTPIKTVTIPKLELTAAVVGKRISKFVMKESRLPVDTIYLWTDSMCTVHWVNSPKVLSVYVANRVKEIQQEKSLKLRFVPTEQNPADLLSRGCPLDELRNNKLWWEGPEFLKKPEAEWPSTEVKQEARQVKEETVQQLSRVTQKSDDTVGQDAIFSKFSSFGKLLRITAWVLRFVHFCRDRQKRSLKAAKFLTADEMHQAQFTWIRRVQLQEYPDLKDKSLTGLCKSLQLFRDEHGVIRSKGRLENSDLCPGGKYPILLPKKHWFTRLVVMDCHERLMHAGLRQTLAQVRLVYWIPQGRQLVQQIQRACRICRAAEGGAFRTPESPPLPPFRVRQSPPFSYVGIDYLGPILVKVSTGVNQFVSKKAWICLFTCAVVRAVHLELISDQSADEFLMALRRFSAQYGSPVMVVCDNASQFQTTSLLLGELSRQQTVQDYSAKEGISWHFIPELAPWMGAFYERLVQTVKRALRKTLGKNLLTAVQLQTVLSEAAAVVNSRPLVLVEHEVGEEALTPAHFLAKQGREGLPSFSIDAVGQFRSQKTGRGALLRRWNEAHNVMAQFWTTWRHEYLAALRERPAVRFNDRNASDITPKVGVVVLIKDQGMPRGKWKMGRIEEIRDSRDGFARSAAVRLPTGRLIVRPLRLLYPLEDIEISETRKVEASRSSEAGSENDFEGFSEDEVEEAFLRLQKIPDISITDVAVSHVSKASKNSRHQHH